MNTIKSPARIRLERGTFIHPYSLKIMIYCLFAELAADLHLPQNIKLLKIDYEAMKLSVRLFPDEGPFADAQLDFELSIPELFPHRPPKVKILQAVKFKGIVILRLHILCRYFIPISITRDTSVWTFCDWIGTRFYRSHPYSLDYCSFYSNLTVMNHWIRVTQFRDDCVYYNFFL